MRGLLQSMFGIWVFVVVGACSSGSDEGAGPRAALVPLPTKGDYRACGDFDTTSPTTGCICSELTQGSSVCLPTCTTTADCPAGPEGAPKIECIASAGGLFSYCVMPCKPGDASTGECPPGYECSGKRTIVGPFCAVPGSPITDVSDRYVKNPPPVTSPASPAAPAKPLCGSPVMLSGALTPSSTQAMRALKTSNGCLASPYADYFVEVQAIELKGTGPHRLTIDACGHSSFPMAIMLFEDPASPAPYDPGNVCANFIGSAESSAAPGCNGGVKMRYVGLEPGTVFVVVSSESPGPTGSATGDYQITVTSETSTCG